MSALKNFAITFLIAALIFGIIAYFVMSVVVDDLFSNDDTPGTISEGTTEEPFDTQIVPNDNPREDGDTFTLLIAGTDYNPEVLFDYEISLSNPTNVPFVKRQIHADMLMVLRFDKENESIVLVSIPGNISLDNGVSTIGELYNSRGREYLIEAVQSLTGFYIDFYAIVNVGNLPDVIDVFGEIEYNVPCDMYYSDESQDLLINLKKGYQKLNGEQVMQLLRYNAYGDSTYSRMSVVSDFAYTFLDKMINVKYKDDATLGAAYESLISLVDTNFTATDLIGSLDLIFNFHYYTHVTLNYPGKLITTTDGNYYRVTQDDYKEAIEYLSKY